MTNIIATIAIAIATTVGFPHTIFEDSPYWNCETMGNLICGTDYPELLYGTEG